MSIDPDVGETDQPYTFVGDDPLNAEDALGLKSTGISAKQMSLLRHDVAIALSASARHAPDAGALTSNAEVLARRDAAGMSSGPLHLSSQQKSDGLIIEAMALNAGIPQKDVIQLVTASYNESHLQTADVNQQSGACGLFQLNDSKNQTAAANEGGCADPIANTAQVVTDYANYIRVNPNAPPGSAGAAVERSGEPASYYAQNLGNLESTFGR